MALMMTASKVNIASFGSDRKRKSTMDMEGIDDTRAPHVLGSIDNNDSTKALLAFIKNWFLNQYGKDVSLEGKWQNLIDSNGFLNETFIFGQLARENPSIPDSVILEHAQGLKKAITDFRNKDGKLPPQSESELSPSSLKEAFNEPYKGTAMQSFQRRLNTYHEEWRHDSGYWFSPYMVVLQSSGYGKSRICKEFALKSLDYWTAYVCLRNSEKLAGYPKGHHAARSFLESVALMTESRERKIELMQVWINSWRIVRKVFQMLFSKQDPSNKEKITPDDLWKFIINQEWTSADVVSETAEMSATTEERTEFWKFCEDTVPADQLHSQCIQQLCSMYKSSKDNWKKLLELSSNKKFLFVIDEARFLLNTKVTNSIIGDDKIVDDNLFRLLRHALKKSDTKNRFVFGALVDTTSNLNNFAPARSVDPSSRDEPSSVVGVQLFPPFTCVKTMDVLCDHDDDRLNEVDSSGDCAMQDATETFDRQSRIFTLGRPLWKTTFQSYTKSATPKGSELTQLKEFAWTKLSCGQQLGGDTSVLVLAVLAVLTGLNVAPESCHSKKLVSSHMATCLKISKDREALYAAYPVEPILTVAALWQLVGTVTDHTFRKSVLDPLLSYIRVGAVNAGHNGELIVKLLLLLAQGKAIEKEQTEEEEEKKDKFAPTKFNDYLKELIGIERKAELIRNKQVSSLFPIFDRSDVSFRCFSKVERHLMKKKTAKEFWKVCNPQNLLKKFYDRCAAMEFPNNHPGADLLVPVRTLAKSNHYSGADNVIIYKYILVQVKNIESFTRNCEGEAVAKLTPTFVFGRDSGWNECDFGFRILVNVGGDMNQGEVHVRNTTDGATVLVLNGLSVFKSLFDCSTNDNNNVHTSADWDEIVAGLQRILHGTSVVDTLDEDEYDEEEYVFDCYKLWSVVDDGF